MHRCVKCGAGDAKWNTKRGWWCEDCVLAYQGPLADLVEGIHVAIELLEPAIERAKRKLTSTRRPYLN